MSAITSANDVANVNANRDPGSGFGDLSSEEFIRIMIAELTTQDPFEPNDTQAILDQLSSLTNIESQTALRESMESLVLQNGVSQAAGMIGKTVQGLDENNDRVTGKVNSVRVVDGVALLELDTGETLPLDRVTRIAQPGGDEA